MKKKCNVPYARIHAYEPCKWYELFLLTIVSPHSFSIKFSFSLLDCTENIYKYAICLFRFVYNFFFLEKCKLRRSQITWLSSMVPSKYMIFMNTFLSLRLIPNVWRNALNLIILKMVTGQREAHFFYRKKKMSRFIAHNTSSISNGFRNLCKSMCEWVCVFIPLLNFLMPEKCQTTIAFWPIQQV